MCAQPTTPHGPLTLNAPVPDPRRASGLAPSRPHQERSLFLLSTHPSIIPADKHDLLASTALADVATIGPRGEPMVNPVWFHWDGHHIRFATTRGTQKVRNLHRDPRIALSIVDPANPGRYLEIRGHVTFASDPDATVINLLYKKYMGIDIHPEPDLDWVVVIVEPERISQMG